MARSTRARGERRRSSGGAVSVSSRASSLRSKALGDWMRWMEQSVTVEDDFGPRSSGAEARFGCQRESPRQAGWRLSWAEPGAPRVLAARKSNPLCSLKRATCSAPQLEESLKRAPCSRLEIEKSPLRQASLSCADHGCLAEKLKSAINQKRGSPFPQHQALALSDKGSANTSLQVGTNRCEFKQRARAARGVCHGQPLDSSTSK